MGADGVGRLFAGGAYPQVHEVNDIMFVSFDEPVRTVIRSGKVILGNISYD